MEYYTAIETNYWYIPYYAKWTSDQTQINTKNSITGWFHSYEILKNKKGETMLTETKWVVS